MIKFARYSLPLLAVALILCSPALAEDVEKRFRFSLHSGGYDSRDQVPNPSSNVLTVVDDATRAVIQFQVADPRNDSAVFSELSLNPAIRTMATVQYAVNKILMIEAAAGYQTGDLGDLDMQAEFNLADVTPQDPFNYTQFKIPVGTVEQVPIQLSAIARFRPRAAFNPYLGGGIGYVVVGFKPSQELNDISLRLDQSVGGLIGLADSGRGYQGGAAPSEDLEGIRVKAPDTFAWHAVGGAEYSFKRKWAAYVDLRYSIASRRVDIRINGESSLGRAVPHLVELASSPLAQASLYGPVEIQTGGLVDGGSAQLREGITISPDTTPAEYCADPGNASDCVFDTSARDGLLDPGRYYIQGGELKYNGFSLGLGIRYTF